MLYSYYKLQLLLRRDMIIGPFWEPIRDLWDHCIDARKYIIITAVQALRIYP